MCGLSRYNGGSKVKGPGLTAGGVRAYYVLMSELCALQRMPENLFSPSSGGRGGIGQGNKS